MGSLSSESDWGSDLELKAGVVAHYFTDHSEELLFHFSITSLTFDLSLCRLPHGDDGVPRQFHRHTGKPRLLHGTWSAINQLNIAMATTLRFCVHVFSDQ